MSTISDIRIFLNGSKGRMGRAIMDAAPGAGCVISGAADAGDDPVPFLDGCDAVIDFSFHTATLPLAAAAAAAGKPLIIGTTGHRPEEKEAVLREAAKVPTVWAGNFSVGVNLLFFLTEAAAGVLDESYDAEIVEMHHRLKKDAPSGTAERLLEILLEVRHRTRGEVRHGREGIIGERPAGEIGMHALRGGGVIGDHTVMFAGMGERIELTHRAGSRAVFAEGALRAARWAVKQQPGVYDMQHVLGLCHSQPDSK